MMIAEYILITLEVGSGIGIICMFIYALMEARPKKEPVKKQKSNFEMLQDIWAEMDWFDLEMEQITLSNKVECLQEEFSILNDRKNSDYLIYLSKSIGILQESIKGIDEEKDRRMDNVQNEEAKLKEK